MESSRQDASYFSSYKWPYCNYSANQLALLPRLRTDFTSSVWNFCGWVEGVSARETSPAARSEGKRLFSQAAPKMPVHSSLSRHQMCEKCVIVQDTEGWGLELFRRSNSKTITKFMIFFPRKSKARNMNSSGSTPFLSSAFLYVVPNFCIHK